MQTPKIILEALPMHNLTWMTSRTLQYGCYLYEILYMKYEILIGIYFMKHSTFIKT